MNKNIRNIIIVALFSVGGGWLGIWLNNVTGNTAPPLQSLGALVWLTTPALSGFLLRAFGGDGWKDSGFGLNLPSGWKWYLVALLVYPLAALLTFGLASLFGILSTDGFAAQGFDAYLSAIGVIFVGSLMKNFFEEFVWRSYLTPRLEAAGVNWRSCSPFRGTRTSRTRSGASRRGSRSRSSRTCPGSSSRSSLPR